MCKAVERLSEEKEEGVRSGWMLPTSKEVETEASSRASYVVLFGHVLNRGGLPLRVTPPSRCQNVRLWLSLVGYIAGCSPFVIVRHTHKQDET